MYDMLNLSLPSRDGEVVHFKSLRLNGVMYYAEVGVEGGREVGGEPEVHESMSPRLSDKHRQKDRETESMSLIQALKKENMELRKDTYRLKEEVETLKDQCLTKEDLQTALDIERQKIIEELKYSITITGLIRSTSTDFSLTSRDSVTAESHEALPELADPTMPLVSTRDEGYSESLEALKNISEMLYAMNKRLESRIDRLEVEREHLTDQVGQLEAQLVKDSMAESEKTSEFVSYVQEAVTQLHAEFQKHEDMTIQLIKDHRQEQNTMKADLQALETKFDSTALMLHRMCEDLSKKITDHKIGCQQFAEEVFKEPDSKVNHSELDPLQKQLDCQISTPKQLKAESPQNDDAAGLSSFSSLSDDSSDDIEPLGPPTLALQSTPPGFASSNQQRNFHRRLKSFRGRDGCRLGKNICKDTSEAKNRLLTIDPRGGNHSQLLRLGQRKYIKLTHRLPNIPNTFSSTGDCKNKAMVNHRKMPSHQTKRLLPLRPQISNTRTSQTLSNMNT